MKLLEVVLWSSIGAMLYLTFVWPFAHSSDPADPSFKPAAIIAFAVFFVSLAAIVAVKACKARRTSS